MGALLRATAEITVEGLDDGRRAGDVRVQPLNLPDSLHVVSRAENRTHNPQSKSSISLMSAGFRSVRCLLH